VLTGPRAHLRPLVIVALGTGMRYGDQVNLRWEKVDFQRNLIYVPNAKTGHEYGVPMNQDVRRELQALKRAAGRSEYVFINPQTGTRYKELKRSFHTALGLAGITNFRWHDLRHTFGTRLGEAGYNAYEIAELMGHSSIKTSERYVHPVEARKRAAVEATMRTTRKDCHSPATEEKQPPQLVAVNS
jgi:integrase